ncbi:hypothetical protein QOT17_015473 [Balamuthia mandrillaris]
MIDLLISSIPHPRCFSKPGEKENPTKSECETAFKPSSPATLNTRDQLNIQQVLNTLLDAGDCNLDGAVVRPDHPVERLDIRCGTSFEAEPNSAETCLISHWLIFFSTSFPRNLFQNKIILVDINRIFV